MSENLSKNDRFFWEDFLDFLNYFLDFRIFPDFSGFFRILISCPNFYLKKINFLIFIFCKIFIFYFHFLFLFFDFSAKFSKKKIVPILKIFQGQ